ncbi:hypothetical protein GE21DRAFT_1218738, partial [Neurospora crassa]
LFIVRSVLGVSDDIQLREPGQKLNYRQTHCTFPTRRSPGWLRVLARTWLDRQLERASGKIAETRGQPSALVFSQFARLIQVHQQQMDGYQKRKAQ